ncbi:MAG: 4Fe-4S binding protein [Methanobrevibacter sp.]|uniref:4Fe-4S binding protein n=1 Tax=Methanobrevibacter sp. TaxID=66852 RepID=UPI001B6811F5|nr:4Fe-4S binding protein [Methanobrevibacter sp.]MBP3791076.1 4Fe-4S binding protein [Methanobrevibacter sp.]
MMNFEKLSKIYFSPSGTTEKIVNEVAKNFNMNRENYDLLSFDESKTFTDELVIIGIPVFDGRIPKLACKRLSKIKGTDTKAIVVLNYGNINYGDALLELVELLKENDFHIVGVATTVSQHSQFNEVGSNRPDASDMERINEFSRKVIEKLNSNTQNEIFVSGYKPFPDYKTPDFSVLCDENLCIECMDCVYTCPEEAISELTPTETNLDDCTRCTTCINVCPENARSFGGDTYQSELENAISNSLERNEVEFFL